MKKLTVLFFLVLAITSVASADHIPIIYGYGTLYAGTATSTPYYTFTFYTARYVVAAGPDVLDDLILSPGLQHCTPCDPRQNLTLLFDSGITQHGNQIQQGRISFDSVSFTWKLGPGGVLQVNYKALPFISLAWCNDWDCNSPTHVFTFSRNQKWDVTAYFKPDAAGGWDFQYARFFGVVPEPSSILLFGTGLGLVASRVRKVRGRVGSKERIVPGIGT